MGEASRIVIKPWLLPLIIAAIVVPGATAFVIGGPGVGLAMGALTAATLVIVAARKRPDEPIEVAGSHDDRRRLLLLATEPVDRPGEVESMQAAAAGPAAASEVLVVAPALDSPLERWASDVRRSRLDAQRKLVLTLGALAAARVEARGAVGDPDPLQAVEDTLREYPADEVIVATDDVSMPQTRRLLDELRRRLDLPVYRLSGELPARLGRSG